MSSTWSGDAPSALAALYLLTGVASFTIVVAHVHLCERRLRSLTFESSVRFFSRTGLLVTCELSARLMRSLKRICSHCFFVALRLLSLTERCPVLLLLPVADLLQLAH